MNAGVLRKQLLYHAKGPWAVGQHCPGFVMFSREAMLHQEKTQCEWADPKPEMWSERLCFSYFQEVKPDVPVRILHELFLCGSLTNYVFKKKKSLDPGLMVHLQRRVSLKIFWRPIWNNINENPPWSMLGCSSPLCSKGYSQNILRREM